MLIIIGQHRRETLRSVAKVTGTSMSGILRDLVDDYLTDWVADRAKRYGPRLGRV